MQQQAARAIELMLAMMEKIKGVNTDGANALAELGNAIAAVISAAGKAELPRS